MTPIAIAVKYLISAGVTGDALVTAIAEIEQAMTPQKSKGAERTARWRERHKASQNVTCDDKKEIPHTPLEKTTSKNLDIPREPSKTRGHRLPDNFEPDQSCWQLAEKLGFTVQQSQSSFDNFLDYWRSVPGAKGLKLDWQATFRTWLRNDSKRQKPNGYTSKPTIGDKWRDGLRQASEFVVGGSGEGAAELSGYSGTLEPVHDLDPGQFRAVGD